MSDPVHIVEPPRTRPGVVSAAVSLLYLLAALEIISLVVQLSQIGTISDVYADAYRGTTVEGSEGLFTAGSVVGAGLGAVFAIGYLLLAVFDGRGKNGARITTWVIAGLAACCGVFGLLGNAASSALTANVDSSDASLPDPQDIQRQLEAALPSWYQPATLTLGVITLLAVIAVIILLALPPSNEFFRKPQPVWQPPYPGTPGGYVQPGAYYPAPPAPPYASPAPPYAQPAPTVPPAPPAPPYAPPAAPGTPPPLPPAAPGMPPQSQPPQPGAETPPPPPPSGPPPW